MCVEHLIDVFTVAQFNGIHQHQGDTYIYINIVTANDTVHDLDSSLNGAKHAKNIVSDHSVYKEPCANVGNLSKFDLHSFLMDRRFVSL